jgi:3-methyladenine DNA glycosylase AlkD
MIVQRLKQELRKYDKPEYKIDAQKFFKETLKERYVLKAAVARKISNQIYGEIKDRSRDEIFSLCDELLESGVPYGRFLAFEWALTLNKSFKKSDFSRFERWLKKYVNSWASCDHLCTGALGRIVLQFPGLKSKTKRWAKSENRWLRRASAVTLIVSARDRGAIGDIFKTADLLLTDEDDMVQKGYGWMLKEAANKFPDEVFGYVMKNKRGMPRTALRYAIEKYPEEKRREAMEKD